MSVSSESPSANPPITCPRCRLSFTPSGAPTENEAPPVPAATGSGTITISPDGPPPTPTPLTPSGLPERVGRFEVKKLLGEGVFGRVYEAYDPQLKRTVALKVAKPEQLASPRRVERFLREAQAAARLIHPNIVAFFETGQDGPSHYIASAFVPGKPLDAVLAGLPEGQTLPLTQAVLIVRKLAEALAHAHQQGVVHRDVKPANVLWREDGEPLLTDFGLASRADETEKLTQAGGFLGTVEYAAPEQWHGQAEASSDQYSLGVLLFELLAGRLPFVGSSTDHYLLLHTQMAAPSPRRFRPQLPRDLETVCLKCLEKEPGKRYRDCGELANDLRRFLDGEPTSARPLGPVERLGRWVGKNPLVASLSAAILLLLVSATGLVAWQWQQAVAALARAEREQQQRALAQVKALRDAAPAAVPAILADFAANRGTILPRLRELWQEQDLPQADHADFGHPRRMRLALALLPIEPDSVRGPLLDWMLRADDPAEVLLVRDALLPQSADLTEGLWQRALEGKVPPTERFRALTALARFDPSSKRWTKAAPSAVEQLLSADPLHLGLWAAGLRPVRQALVSPLGEVFRGQRLPEMRLTAATVLADYAADQPEVLSKLLLDAEPKQYALILPVLQRHRAEAVRYLRPVLTPGATVGKEQGPLPRQQAQAAVTLLHLGETEPVWPLFRHSPDPEARSQLIWQVGLLGVKPRLLVQRLEQEKDLTARRALIVSLGEFPAEQLPAEIRQPLTGQLLDWYRHDPDPGIHGAIDWLLRHGKEGLIPRPLDWGQANQLRQIDEELKRGDPDGKRQWYVNGQGQTMILVPGPVEFLMGAPLSEPGRSDDETPHRQRIGRGFAIASKPVTVAQFQSFQKERPEVWHGDIKRYSPEPDGPIVAVTWFEAAQYCNWLNEKEGIARKEWCYPLEIKEGMKPFPDYLQRKGYRLPTEAEWEYACRADTCSSRYYGSSEALLPRYVWYLQNSEDRAWPVGQKRPNDLGLFDMHGNVWNWCQEGWRKYQPGKDGKPAEDEEDSRDIVDPLSRSLRGGSYFNRPSFVRCAFRNGLRPSGRGSYCGLRPARTYH